MRVARRSQGRKVRRSANGPPKSWREMQLLLSSLQMLRLYNRRGSLVDRSGRRRRHGDQVQVEFCGPGTWPRRLPNPVTRLHGPSLWARIPAADAPPQLSANAMATSGTASFAGLRKALTDRGIAALTAPTRWGGLGRHPVQAEAEHR